MKQFFHIFAKKSAALVGSTWAFMISIIFVTTWLLTGPIFHFSDSWQLVINTGTNVVTFIIVFLIQNTQNRDTEMMQIKLDELIRSHRSAHKSIINLEKLSDEQIKSLEEHYEKLSGHAKK